MFLYFLSWHILMQPFVLLMKGQKRKSTQTTLLSPGTAPFTRYNYALILLLMSQHGNSLSLLRAIKESDPTWKHSFSNSGFRPHMES